MIVKDHASLGERVFKYSYIMSVEWRDYFMYKMYTINKKVIAFPQETYALQYLL